MLPIGRVLPMPPFRFKGMFPPPPLLFPFPVINRTLLGVVTELTYKIDTLERFFFVYFVRERVGRHTLSSIFFDGAVSVTLLATLYLMLSFAISLICLVGPDSAVSASARALLLFFFCFGGFGGVFFFLPREPSVIFALNPLCCALVLQHQITETFAYAVIASITTSTYLISLVLFAISVHTRKEAIVTTLKVERLCTQSVGNTCAMVIGRGG